MFEIEKFLLVGNNLSVDFVNTKIASDCVPKDLLEDFADLVAWAVATKLVEPGEANTRYSSWVNKGHAVLRDAIRFRSVLHALYTEIIAGNEIKAEGIAAINKLLREQNGYSELVSAENGLEKRFRADFGDPRQILAPIAESAADLLCFGDMDLVKKCENPECVLYFYDTSKNHKRRWCSMAGCGNRAKAAAFYERKKSAEKALSN